MPHAKHAPSCAIDYPIGWGCSFHDAPLLRLVRCQEQAISDRQKFAGRLDQRPRRQFSNPINFDGHSMLLSYLVDQQVEISIARCQYHDVRVRREIQNIQRDPNVPVTFCRTIVPTNEWFQFDLETYRTQNVLK